MAYFFLGGYYMLSRIWFWTKFIVVTLVLFFVLHWFFDLGITWDTLWHPMTPLHIAVARFMVYPFSLIIAFIIAWVISISRGWIK
jgi:hypothetical protein